MPHESAPGGVGPGGKGGRGVGDGSGGAGPWPGGQTPVTPILAEGIAACACVLNQHSLPAKVAAQQPLCAAHFAQQSAALVAGGCGNGPLEPTS